MEFSNEEAYNERVHYENPFLSVRIFQARNETERLTNWHYHKELEMIVVQDGVLDVYVEDELFPLQAGDVILIGSSQLHRDRSYQHAGLDYIVLQFDIQQYFESSTLPYYRFFADPGVSLSRLNYIFQENEEARQIVVGCIKEIYRESKVRQTGYEIAISLLIKQIILTLLRNDARQLINLKESADLLRLKPVLDYIEQHLSEKIQVEEACRLVNISYFYFVKYFKKTLGMSFLEYVNHQKIKRAERILLTRDISVAQAAEEVGMPNMAHFYKVFKKHNDCSPNHFRKKRSEWG